MDLIAKPISGCVCLDKLKLKQNNDKEKIWENLLIKKLIITTLSAYLKKQNPCQNTCINFSHVSSRYLIYWLIRSCIRSKSDFKNFKCFTYPPFFTKTHYYTSFHLEHFFTLTFTSLIYLAVAKKYIGSLFYNLLYPLHILILAEY